MKVLFVLLFFASLGANIWQYERASEMEESWSLQKTTIAKQKKLIDQTTKDIQSERQSSSRTVKSAQGLLDRSEKLMNEIDRLAAENAGYRQRFGTLDASVKGEPANQPVVIPLSPTPSPLAASPPIPTPTPANGKKKR